jgi:hypothetical protein
VVEGHSEEKEGLEELEVKAEAVSSHQTRAEKELQHLLEESLEDPLYDL